MDKHEAILQKYEPTVTDLVKECGEQKIPILVLMGHGDDAYHSSYFGSLDDFTRLF